MKIGCIGQGWIGKHLADHFVERSFAVVRYANTDQFCHNKDAIAACDVVFVAVPTPTKPSGFDDSILRSVISLVGKGKIAVIKSTVLPGTTDSIQEQYTDTIVLHSPEFLRESSVKHDIDFPDRNIVGIPSKYSNHPLWKDAANQVMDILPRAPYQLLSKAVEAEIIKYAGNNFLYTKVVFMNLVYDLTMACGANFDVVLNTMKADPRIGDSHMQPVHQYAHMNNYTGRGAGGHCFIKDFAAFREFYERVLPEDKEAQMLLRALEEKNNKLLRDSKKDMDLLRAVYGV